MSDVALPPVDPIVADMREPLFGSVTRMHQREEQAAASLSRAGWWVGGIGAGIGVLGMTCLTAALIYITPPVRYTVIDKQTGVIEESFGAKDAPAHFSQRVIEHYLAEYVRLREQWVWQLDPQTYHRVAIMSSPDEQKRYVAERAKENPGKLYGQDGYARVDVDPHMVPHAKGRDGTLEYDVRFTKTALLATNPGKPVTTREVAHVSFQFHPELPMASQQDRIDNEAGLYVVFYSKSTD